MKYRQLGNSGLKVSALGLGCMGLSAFYGPTDEKTSLEVIKKSYEMGINFFDTADMYGNGANETLLGKALKGLRDKAIIATKCGIQRIGGELEINNTPAYIRAACEGSLKRLDMETIDLYYLHRYNPNVPLEESMGEMLKLLEEGKIRFVGLSEVDGEVVEGAHRILGDRLVALQSEFSIVNRKPAEIALPTCRRLGIAFVPFSPIARGLLSGKLKDTKTFTESAAYDFRSEHPQFQPETLKANMRLVYAISEIAAAKKCTPAQLSLAWLLAQGNDIIPIPGTKRLDYLVENIGAIDISLSPSELAALEKAMDDHPVHGARYPEAILKKVYLKF